MQWRDDENLRHIGVAPQRETRIWIQALSAWGEKAGGLVALLGIGPGAVYRLVYHEWKTALFGGRDKRRELLPLFELKFVS